MSECSSECSIKCCDGCGNISQTCCLETIANEDNMNNVNNVTVCLLLTDKATAVKGEKTKKSKNAPAEMPSNKPVRR